MPHGAKQYEREQITMLTFDDSYFLGETRDGFYIEPMMKCAWATQLEVMCVIKQICEKYDIPYFAYYGTLLGTIRHKGFIPWDDDMDICMLRKDYQRFLEVAPRELTGEYHINSPYTQDEYTYVFSRILNASSISYDPSRLSQFHRCPYIVGVDIFPLDALPTNPSEESLLNQLIYILISVVGRYDDNPEDIMAMLPELEQLCNIKLDTQRSIKNQLLRIADSLCQTYNTSDSSIISYIPEDSQKSIHLQRKWFDSYDYLPFENIFLPVPKNYDAILTALYSDYMTPIQHCAGHDYPFYKKQITAMAQTITQRIINGEKPFTF